MPQPQHSWQVISNWVVPNSTESVHVAAFATYEEARAEAQRLMPLVGTVVGGRLLKGVQFVGDFKEIWKQLPSTC